MPKMPEFGIPCIVSRLVQAGGDGEEKQSHQITVRNRILIKTPQSTPSLSPPLQGGIFFQEILIFHKIWRRT